MSTIEIEGMTFPEPKVIPAFAEIIQEVEEATAKSKRARPIKTEADLNTVAEILAAVEWAVRHGETTGVDLGRPYRTYAERLSKEAKELVSPLKAVSERLKEEISTYQGERQALIDKERAKQMKLAERRQERENKRAAREGRDPIIHKPPVIDDVDTTIKLDDGGEIQSKNFRKYKVVNFAELPDEFKQENKGALNKSCKAGDEAPPGAEFYYDTTTSFNF